MNITRRPANDEIIRRIEADIAREKKEAWKNLERLRARSQALHEIKQRQEPLIKEYEEAMRAQEIMDELDGKSS